MSSPTIHVTTCFNKEWIIPALILANSIKRLHTSSRSVIFHAIDIDAALTQADCDLLNSETFQVRTHNPEMKAFASIDLSTGFFSSHANYCRLMIADILTDIDKVIYLDTDVVVVEPLSALYDTELSSAIAACHDCLMEGLVDRGDYGEKIIGHLARMDISSEEYFNSGVMLIDLIRWRKDHIFDKCLAITAAPPFPLLFVDQDVLNILFKNNYTLLDPMWNILALREEECVEDKTRDAPYVIHFAGHAKPWVSSHTRTRLDQHFWNAAVASPFLHRLLDVREKTNRAEARAAQERLRKQRPLIRIKAWGEFLCTASKLVSRAEKAVGAKSSRLSSALFAYGDRVFEHSTRPPSYPYDL